MEVDEKLDIPIDVFIWDEIAQYKADWVKVGRARTSRGLDLLIGKARARAKKWGASEWQRPYLTTGGPRLGTVRLRAVVDSPEA
jgi:hypothetical protein